MQVDVPSVPICRNINIPTVNSHRIRFGKSRRLRIARLEFITMIGVDGYSVSLYFPVTGYLNIIPRICIRIRVSNVVGKLFVRVYKVEFPGSVQQAVILASFELATQGISAIVVCHKRSAWILFVDFNYLHILPIGGHGFFSHYIKCCQGKYSHENAC